MHPLGWVGCRTRYAHIHMPFEVGRGTAYLAWGRGRGLADPGGGHAAQARVDGPDMTRMAVGPGGPDAVGGLLVPSGRSAPSRCLGSFRVSTGPAMVRAEPGRVTTLRQASAVSGAASVIGSFMFFLVVHF